MTPAAGTNREILESLSDIERWVTVLVWLGIVALVLLAADGIGAAWEWWRGRRDRAEESSEEG
jgi:hypothetical protein